MAKKQNTDKLQRMLNIAKGGNQGQPQPTEDKPAQQKESEKQVPKKSSKPKKKSDMDQTFEGIRKEDTTQSQYSPFRMKTEVLDEMKRIAHKEKVTYPGRLVHKVLSEWIEDYKKEKE